MMNKPSATAKPQASRAVQMLMAAFALLLSAAAWSSLVGAAALTTGCPGDAPDACQCLVCSEDAAVAIDVSDEEGVEVEDFVVEVLYNGQNLGQPEGCTPESREGDNSCTFGSELGIYQVVILAPGYERYEGTVRISDEGEREVCCRACLSSRELDVILKPRE